MIANSPNTPPNFCVIGFYGHCPDEASATGLSCLLYRPELDPIRHDPSFVHYLEPLGLTEAHARAQARRAAHPPEKVAAKP